ncbi:unnamed protein product, partial [Phaeothamnion confervicola]
APGSGSDFAVAAMAAATAETPVAHAASTHTPLPPAVAPGDVPPLLYAFPLSLGFRGHADGAPAACGQGRQGPRAHSRPRGRAGVKVAAGLMTAADAGTRRRLRATDAGTGPEGGVDAAAATTAAVAGASSADDAAEEMQGPRVSARAAGDSLARSQGAFHWEEGTEQVTLALSPPPDFSPLSAAVLYEAASGASASGGGDDGGDASSAGSPERAMGGSLGLAARDDASPFPIPMEAGDSSGADDGSDSSPWHEAADPGGDGGILYGSGSEGAARGDGGDGGSGGGDSRHGNGGGSGYGNGGGSGLGGVMGVLDQVMQHLGKRVPIGFAAHLLRSRAGDPAAAVDLFYALAEEYE